MATIKPIEGRTVHQIQSGQVIVDLCSVVKELVENSVDAGATSIGMYVDGSYVGLQIPNASSNRAAHLANAFNTNKDVRFKNQGLDSIEVQDNGPGISPDNYENIALKHYTSKLSAYDDLATLQTFGFRGEALSSLCALSQFNILTCLAKDVPKGTKLEFETSGKLKGTSIVAAQKGTNVIVENLFHNLPVRRRELERNIKREWNKVISLLNQYACIQTGVKFSVSQQPTKGKRIVLFSTKGNPSTRENLINIFGAKTMAVLVKLDLDLEFEPTVGFGLKTALTDKQVSAEVHVQGYVSRPAHGEGRQTPDRQMFFVNGRPCGLPQFAKVFNEVYRAYNSTQSPFIFADIQLDPHLYDVNVSPDKRTILLHDQNKMLETLKEALVTVFQSQDYSIPVAQPFGHRSQRGPQSAMNGNDESKSEVQIPRQPATATEKATQAAQSDESCSEEDDGTAHSVHEPTGARRTHTAKSRKLTAAELQSQSLISRWVGRIADDRYDLDRQTPGRGKLPESGSVADARKLLKESISPKAYDESAEEASASPTEEMDFTPLATSETPRRVLDFHARLTDMDDQEDVVEEAAKAREKDNGPAQAEIPAITPIKTPRDTTNAPTTTQRLSKRPVAEVATVTIGDQTLTGLTESHAKRARVDLGPGSKYTPFKSPLNSTITGSSFGTRLSQMFSAAQSTRKQPISKEISEESDDIDMTAVANEEIDYEHLESSPVDPSGETMESASCDERPTSTPKFSLEPSSPGDDSVEESPSHNMEKASTQPATEDEQSRDPLPEQANNASNKSHVPRAGFNRKDATLQCRQNMKLSEADLKSRVNSWISELERAAPRRSTSADASGIESKDAEEVLSLIISKADFGKMTIVGQFNLGFIIAVRHAARDPDGDGSSGDSDDELFIIDQHASDEKYNFERLQSTTVVQSQRLVYPKQLELTALEEEIVRENMAALDVNGFKVRLDDSGGLPVGSRCRLLALPLSRETTFTLSDLEELISLLSDHHSNEASSAPRPSKVRSMFAMRACRSSVMIGKALTHRQMAKLVRHMGELDKPWNCPHGRPTMRHLSGLGSWDENGWKETDSRVNWAKYAQS